MGISKRLSLDWLRPHAATPVFRVLRLAETCTSILPACAAYLGTRLETISRLKSRGNRRLFLWIRLPRWPDLHRRAYIFVTGSATFQFDEGPCFFFSAAEFSLQNAVTHYRCIGKGSPDNGSVRVTVCTQASKTETETGQSSIGTNRYTWWKTVSS